MNVIERAAEAGFRMAVTGENVFDTSANRKEIFGEYGLEHSLGLLSVWVDYSSASTLLMKDRDVISPARSEIDKGLPVF